MYYLPHNNEAEQGLLGSLLVDNRGVEQIGDFFKPEYFYTPVHARIYEAILHFTEAGQNASPVTLKGFFENDADLNKVGGAGYLADLAANVISIINTVDYARTLTDLWFRRKVIDLAQDASAKAQRQELHSPAWVILEETEEALFSLAETEQEGGPAPLSDALGSALSLIESAQKGERNGMKTGIFALDNLNGGFYPGQLVTVAGRPSMGKTAFAMTIAHNVAAAGGSVLFFSMEMTREEIAQRLYARATGFATGHQLREGAFKTEEFRRMIEAQASLAGLPIHIDESGQLAPAQIRARARRHKRRSGLDLILIDYLNIMKMPDRYQSKVDQIAEITSALKGIAKDLHVPIILLAQLNREVEKREDKRPNMADLRDSGAIEQDSDIVLLLHREEYYLEREGVPKKRAKDTDESHLKATNSYYDRMAAAKGKADIFIGKWRQGRVGDVTCGFNGTRQIFHDLDH